MGKVKRLNSVFGCPGVNVHYRSGFAVCRGRTGSGQLLPWGVGTGTRVKSRAEEPALPTLSHVAMDVVFRNILQSQNLSSGSAHCGLFWLLGLWLGPMQAPFDRGHSLIAISQHGASQEGRR